MARLSTRHDYDAALAEKFIERCNEPHTVQWKANVIRGEEQIAENLPDYRWPPHSRLLRPGTPAPHP